MDWHQDAAYEHPPMNIISVVGRNVMALKEASKESGGNLSSYARIEKRTAELGHVVPRTTVERIAKGVRSSQLADIEAIARAFDLEPWQLLVPNFSPSNAPVLRSIGPVEDDMYSRFKRLAKEIAGLPNKDE